MLFHITVAAGVAALVGASKLENSTYFSSNSIKKSLVAFGAGVLSHGLLDITPHCYPIDSKIDVIVSFSLILFAIWRTNKPSKLIVASAFLGSIFPDLVDLAPQIIEKLVGIEMPKIDKIFPWHWHQYSGSLYSGSCSMSTLYHFLVVIVVTMICWFRRKALANFFS